MRRFGHVRQRRPGPNRPWTAYWSENSKRLHQGGFPTERDAERFLARRQAEIETGLSIAPSDMTVSEYIDQWLSRRRDLGPASIASYRGILKRRIGPHLGHIHVQRLQPLAIDTWIGELVKLDYAPNSIHGAYAVLHAAMDDAVAANVIQVNPADSPIIRLPKQRKPDIEHWTAEEAQQFLTATDGEPHATLFRFMLASQLRIGEALALPWDLIDLTTGELWVRWNLRQRDRQIAEVKTTYSRRRVTLDADTIDALRIHRDRLKFYQRSSDLPQLDLSIPGHALVFPHQNGGPLVPFTVQRQLTRLCKLAGVRRITPHGLRHTGATLLLLAGVPLHVVSRRLGHHSAAFTADVYAHSLPSQETEAATLIGNVLGREVG